MAEKLIDLQNQRALLVAARNSGATRVEYNDRTINYRSLDEMDRLIARLDAQIAETPGSGAVTTTKPARRLALRSHKGLY